MQKPLSDTDIKTILTRIHSDANIIFLPDMANVNTPEDVFKGRNHAIVFVATNSEFSGHWQIFMRCAGKIYFFDSYGHNFTILLEKVFRNYGQGANRESFKLGKIIASTPEFTQKRVVMNTKRYQSLLPDDNTCGRHACVCFMLFNDDCESFSFEKYARFMNSQKAKLGPQATYDDVVIKITDNILKS